MTWRLLYVPHVGHAVCGSLGERQLGQAISCGAVAFHCARRDLVLLRDILRLGTATSVLLCLSRRGIWLRLKVFQCRPHRAVLLMPVARLGVSQPDPALYAQALAA